MVYSSLCWAGYSLLHLVTSRNSLYSIVWITFSFGFLALAAFSLNMVENAIWVRRKFFQPDPDSTIRLS
jgi:hypothetical protein